MEPDATWGRLLVPGVSRVMFTVERPWVYNRPFESCIPTGMYALSRHDSINHPRSWAMTSETVTLKQYANMGSRYGCLLHVGNFVTDVVGCISPGRSIAWFDGKKVQGVTNSGDTMQAIDEALIRTGTRHIEIV